MNGPILQATVNAVLALYGQPEPHPTDALSDIAAHLNALAAEQRWVATGEKP